MGNWVNKEHWTMWGTARRSGFKQVGVQGDGYTPNAYHCIRGSFGPPSRMPNGAYQPQVDIPNLGIVSSPISQGAAFAPAARNRAWSDLIENVRSGPASLGVALAEWPQSLGMIGTRALTLASSYRQLRRGDFRGALKALRVPPKRKHRSKVRSAVGEASSLWLEYSFGWSPLCQDIYDGLHALGQPLPGGKVSGSGRETRNWYPGGVLHFEMNGFSAVKQGAEIFVVNPNTYALQQLGLANPAEIVWELVPFSFLVDWVFDVGTSLGGLTDLLGCSVSNPYTTIVVKERGRAVYDWNYSPKQKFYAPGWTLAMKRVKGLSKPSPNLSYRANIGQSMKRAANAVSLLGQILSK